MSRFEDLRALGAGRSGLVRVARDRARAGARVVLKSVPAGARDEVEREYRVLSAVGHPALARAIDLVEVDGAPTVVLDFVPGEALDVHVRRHGPLEPELGRGLAAALLSALDRLHGESFLHLDVKPPNVIVRRDGGRIHAVLVDAGLALARSAASFAGSAGGTEAYAAPEVRAGGAVDPRADLFSLGRTLRETVEVDADSALAAFVGRLDAERAEARFPSAAAALDDPHLRRAHAAWRRSRLVRLPWIARHGGVDRPLERVVRSGVVELVGPPGSGKSALLDRHLRAARLAGKPVFLTRGSAGLGFSARLAASLGVEAPSDDGTPGIGDGESAVFRRTTRALRALPADAVLLVDDADRLEPDVLSALRTAGFGREVSSGGLLLASGRPLGIGAAVIELPPVEPAALAAAISRPTGARLDAALVRRVAERVCEGKRGVVRGIVEAFATAFRRASGTAAALESIDRGAIPAAPRLGRTAVERLGALERRLVEALAVARDPLDESVLSAFGAPESDEGSVASALAALRERGLVLRHADGRRELHPRVAAAIRSRGLGARTVREIARRFADHSKSPEREQFRFLSAPSPETDRALAEVLDALREHGAPRTALDRASRAVEAEPQRARRCRFVAVRARIDRGELKEAESALREAARRTGGEGEFAALVALARAELAQARGAVDETRRWAARARERAVDARTRSRASNLEGVALYRAAEYEEVLRRARGPAEPGEGEVERSLRANLAGIAALRLGRLDEALDALRSALAGFESVGSSSGGAMVRNNLALVESRRGRPAAALRHLLTLRRHAIRHDAPIREALAANNAALILRDSGRLDRARRLLDDAVRIRRAVGERYGLGSSLSNRATVLAELGAASEALRDVDEAIESFRQAGSPAKELIARKNRVRTLAALGDDEAFREAALDARERAREAGEPVEEGDVLRHEAIVWARNGDGAAAAERLAAAVARFVEAGDEWRVTEARVERAIVAPTAPPAEEERSSLVAALREGRARESSRERRGMIALGLARIGGEEAEACAVEAFETLVRSGRPRWRLLAAAAAAEVASRQGRTLALDRALAVGREALDRLERGAPGWIDPGAAAVVRAFAPESGGSERSTFAGPAATLVGERAGDLHAVLDLYRRLAKTNDVESLLDAILDAALTLSGGSRALLLVREERDDAAVVLRARDDDAAPLEEPEEQYSRAVLETVLGSGRPVVLGDAALDPRWSGHLSVRRLRLRSVACVPLGGRGTTLGALYVDQSGRSRAFDPGRLELLERFADQASLALERVRDEGRIRALNRQLERKLARVERALGAERRAGGMTGALRPALRIAGSHPSIERVRLEIERAAVTDLPVLLTGETGTGKGLAARCLHDASPRAGGPFVVLDGAAIPESLFEAEVFGTVEGAFTGAADRLGIVGEADGGTLFLDEIDAVPPSAQAKLLRFLERGEVRPVGGGPRRVDVRIVSAASE
ncbi:MAG: sigma 54-interacting transcriptional regulator, partial [Planctomycetota bacterium JB042]